MKKSIFLILTLLPLLSLGQTAVPITQGSKYYEFRNGVRIDSAFFHPRKDTVIYDLTLKAPGMTTVRPQDSLPYYFNGVKWFRQAFLSDIPSIGNFIHNQNTSPQAADFYIGGTGTADTLTGGSALGVSDEWRILNNSGSLQFKNIDGNVPLSTFGSSGVGIEGGLILSGGNTSMDFGGTISPHFLELTNFNNVNQFGIPARSKFLMYDTISSRANLVPTNEILGAYVPTARTINIIGGNDISAIGGTQDLGANRTWTLNNTSTLQSVTDRGNITTTGIFAFNLSSTSGTSLNGQPHVVLQNSGESRFIIGLDIVETGSGNAGSDLFVASYDDGENPLAKPIRIKRSTGVTTFSATPMVGSDAIWYAGNDASGSAFTPTLSGANVLSTFTTNATGRVTALTTRTLAPSDIGAAASTITLQDVTLNDNTSNRGIRLTGDAGISSGPAALESYYDTGNDWSIINSLDRTGATFKPLKVGSSGAEFKGNSTTVGNALTAVNSAGTSILEAANNGVVTLNGLKYISGSGSPESVVTANVGSWYSDLTNGIPYFKKTGSGNTGWKAVTLAP